MSRRHRVPFWVLSGLFLLALGVPSFDRDDAPRPPGASASLPQADEALRLVDRLAVKGRAPRTGYRRDAFGPAWQDVDHNGCRTRDDVLRRDLTQLRLRNRCVVVAGTLVDPYTHRRLAFAKARAA